MTPLSLRAVLSRGKWPQARPLPEFPPTRLFLVGDDAVTLEPEGLGFGESMRVLQVLGYYVPAYEWGGPVRSTSALNCALRDLGVRVDVLTTNTRGSEDLPKESSGLHAVGGVRVRYFEAFGPRRYFFSPGLFAAVVMRAANYDVVHLQGLWTFPVVAGASAARLSGIPYVLSPRGSLKRWAMGQKAMKKGLYAHLVERRTIRGAAAIHLTSESERDELPNWTADTQTVVVPNAVDTTGLALLPAPYRTTPGAKLVVLGRVHPVKGFDVLLPALARAKSVVRDVSLVIAGPDEDGYVRHVMQTARELGLENCVSYVGPQNRQGVIDVLAEAEVLVAPSYQESFGMAVCEGMAASRPVIVSPEVPLADAILSAGAGIVARNDVGRLASAIVELAVSHEEWPRMGAAGRALVDTEWSTRAVAKEMISLYERVRRRS